jgi:hypothetical protein
LSLVVWKWEVHQRVDRVQRRQPGEHAGLDGAPHERNRLRRRGDDLSREPCVAVVDERLCDKTQRLEPLRRVRLIGSPSESIAGLSAPRQCRDERRRRRA